MDILLKMKDLSVYGYPRGLLFKQTTTKSDVWSSSPVRTFPSGNSSGYPFVGWFGG
jgi:hypothetical protein